MTARAMPDDRLTCRIRLGDGAVVELDASPQTLPLVVGCRWFAAVIRPGDESLAVYVCLGPADFRKQAAGLSALVQVNLELDPFAPALFAFTNRWRDAVRLLYWERNGFVLWSKKLQRAGPTHPGCGVLRPSSPRAGSLKPDEDFTYGGVQFSGSISASALRA